MTPSMVPVVIFVELLIEQIPKSNQGSMLRNRYGYTKEDIHNVYRDIINSYL